MSKLNGGVPKEVIELSEQLSGLPGIGPKQAFRLAIYLTSKGRSNTNKLINSAKSAIDKVGVCQQCANLSSEEICEVCSDTGRNDSKLMVLESVVDLVQIETQTDYDGYYLVLGGLISPLNGIFAQDINSELFYRALKLRNVEEVIFALPTTVEGEATISYLSTLDSASPIKYTKVARGLPTGASLEYADAATLNSAISSRVSY